MIFSSYTVHWLFVAVERLRKLCDITDPAADRITVGNF
jgi:hypothetical protein